LRTLFSPPDASLLVLADASEHDLQKAFKTADVGGVQVPVGAPQWRLGGVPAAGMDLVARAAKSV
jgi:hypothetical protein